VTTLGSGGLSCERRGLGKGRGGELGAIPVDVLGGTVGGVGGAEVGAPDLTAYLEQFRPAT